MLPEPLTSPSTRTARLFYGMLVGALMYSSVHFAVTDTFMFAFDPEIALLVGCLFAFGVRLAAGTARRVAMRSSPRRSRRRPMRSLAMRSRTSVPGNGRR